MKIGAFMIGGLVGATAAVMLSRNNRSKWMMAGLSAAGESMGKMFNQKNWLTGDRESRKWSSGEERHTQNKWDSGSSAQSHTASASSASKENLTEVQDIVDKDPELKKQVTQILSENDPSSKFANH